jgi:hypothetical protein
MARQERLKFDYEEYFNEKLEYTAVLMWNTHHQAFTFAFYLNQVYNLNLERRDDIESGDGATLCPLYSCQSDNNQIAFFLVDRPATTSMQSEYFDKIMLIVGADAFEIAQNIYNETSQSGEKLPASPEHEEILNSFVETGIFECAMFDFSDPDRPETTYFPTTNSNAALQKKRSRFMKEQRETVTDIILALESLLPEYDSE